MLNYLVNKEITNREKYGGILFVFEKNMLEMSDSSTFDILIFAE